MKPPASSTYSTEVTLTGAQAKRIGELLSATDEVTVQAGNKAGPIWVNAGSQSIKLDTAGTTIAGEVG